VPRTTREVHLESLDLAKRFVEVAADKLAADILLLDVRSLTTIADYFVICSGNGERQAQAIARDVLDKAAADGIKPLHDEGLTDSRWVLLDYGSVIVHVFTPAERDYYRLERLWSRAVPVVRIQ
jgi:ribosome-associated protein